MPNEPENLGLLGLMLLQDSRRAARVTHDGRLVVLEDQDRTLWNADQIASGVALVERALRMRAPGPYQLQAAIAALHAEAPSSAETDWQQVAALYGELARMSPSPVVRLNQAVAIAMGEGLEKGLALIDELDASGELATYHLLHAARADLLRRLGRNQEAAGALREGAGTRNQLGGKDLPSDPAGQPGRPPSIKRSNRRDSQNRFDRAIRDRIE